MENFDLTLKETLKKLGNDHQLKGTILLASEGINASLEGLDESLDSFLKIFLSNPLFAGIPIKRTKSSGGAYKRLWVKIKKEIVTFGVSEINPAKKTGRFVSHIRR